MKNSIEALLTERRFASISEWGILALLCRHANRYFPILQSAYRTDVRAVLRGIETIAADGSGDSLPYLCHRMRSNLIEQTDSEHNAKRHAAQALSYVALCLNNTWAESREAVLASSRSALHHMVMSGDQCASESLVQINDDIEALVDLARSTEEAGLRTPAQLRRGGPPDKVSQTVFARYTKFENARLIEVGPLVDAKLVAYFRRFPKRLFELSGRQFEELIAEIFDRFGFLVELTAPTKDKGRDVIAISEEERLKYLIECKRWERNVGIAIVQRLHGVARGEGATKGIVATTSRFTREARYFLDSEPVCWQLEGRDFDGVTKWLADYDRLKADRLRDQACGYQLVPRSQK